jgi:glutathione S-transferase
MLKIWGRPNSINVQKAMWAVGELGLAHEHENVGMEYGGNDQDWYLKLNPNGRVPAIDDDGFVLYESNAIVRYLAAKYGAGTLQPDDVQGRALADQWMDWQQTTLSPAMFQPFWGLIRTKPEDRDMTAIEKGIADCARLFKQLDAWLAGRSFVAADRLTTADLPVGVAVYRWYQLPIERPEVSNVAAWYERLKARPAYRTHVMLPLT